MGTISHSSHYCNTNVMVCQVFSSAGLGGGSAPVIVPMVSPIPTRLGRRR
jgi:hypothetical protein